MNETGQTPGKKFGRFKYGWIRIRISNGKHKRKLEKQETVRLLWLHELVVERTIILNTFVR